jgi:SAM-dependent methyltransferase
VYTISGKKPWSYGYNDTRWQLIYDTIRSAALIDQFSKGLIPEKFGIGFDERVAEYPWIFSKLHKTKNAKILDAGSTFNFSEIVEHNYFKEQELTIFTFYPEPINFVHKRISYVFGDLRAMPFKQNYFDQIVCQSTIEHVDMDNSIYGYYINKNEDKNKKSYEYLHVIDELVRVLSKGGKLLLTFPFGKFEHHGFFQQFDAEMVEKIKEKLSIEGNCKDEYLQYSTNGWQYSNANNCANSESYNPHTGKGKGNDGAAHCRAVCCIEFIKK